MQPANQYHASEGVSPSLSSQHQSTATARPADADRAHSLTGCFLSAEIAATASEYAAIFAVMLIALMVCVNVVGRNLGRAVQSADAKLAGGGAAFLAGEAAGPAHSSKTQPKNDRREEDRARYYARPNPADTSDHAPDVTSPQREAGQQPASVGVSKVRRIFKGNQIGSKSQEN